MVFDARIVGVLALLVQSVWGLIAGNVARLVRNDPADGGENLLHRGLLPLCRLRHRSSPLLARPFRAPRPNPVESGISNHSAGMESVCHVGARRGTLHSIPAMP